MSIRICVNSCHGNFVHWVKMWETNRWTLISFKRYKYFRLKSCVLLMIFRFLVRHKCLLFGCLVVFPPSTQHIYTQRSNVSMWKERKNQYWLQRKLMNCVICHNYLNTKKEKIFSLYRQGKKSNLYVMSGWVLFWFLFSQKKEEQHKWWMDRINWMGVTKRNFKIHHTKNRY